MDSFPPQDAASPGVQSPRHHDIRALLANIYRHVPHPHIAAREANRPASPAPKLASRFERFNTALGVKITAAVGTMWCAYAFCALALVSLPSAMQGGVATMVAWTAQTFIQLVLLSIIMVGQKIAGEANDKRAIDTYNDAEAVLHEALEIQAHLAAQDKALEHLIEHMLALRQTSATTPA